ncbi:alpha/beta hydrolase-fold protein [Pokkaliibacter sp. MBI-7]|uniref:alpha/beta hydrolase-fold protein n=1 Tax=Pokkaliibacter sp. MBI-7 TaxID=3040600 RepID=UPI00244BDF49|nr:alpha/beta hydrolase-fold protein [Pokkaliibacter sp. MBI-7]MDH2434849.1 alpha/beta hydrolase-fold protein [Pokkaliibacter sp. MBI-7]
MGLSFWRTARFSLPVLTSVWLAVGSHTIYADESDDAASKARWDVMADMAALYMREAPASEFVDAGDDEKSKHGNYAGALAYYLAATKLDTNYAFASYQAAAALSYLDMPKVAAKYLKEAQVRGFWQYPIMQEDEELAPMKESAAYQELLSTAQTNYALHAQDAGKGAFQIPQATPPKDGWPVVVWLHGLGSNGSIDGFSELAKDQYALVGLNGTIKRDENSFMWDKKSAEDTHKAVQQALAEISTSTVINRNKVVLIGFSQGALHAAHLLAEHPESYTGGVLLSPGGYLQKFPVFEAKGKHVVVVGGDKEHESNKRLLASIRELFIKDNQLIARNHPGGHFFQDDWEQVYPQFIAFALGELSTL